jgi:energy-coupling factor transport system substrate-specific component
MMSNKGIKRWINVVVIGVILLLLSFTFFLEGQYLLFSILMIVLIFLPFIVRFERRQVSAEEMVIIGMLAAIAALSRVPFASLPSVQPTSFVVIITGRVFGREAGFLVGALAAVVSNLFLGQGPWTPWQMFCWGMIGFSAGLFANQRWMQTKIGLLLFGGAWGFLFGWIMNLWYMLGFFDTFNWIVFVTVYTASFYFDLAHALSNIFFLAIFASAWQKILERVKKKYGLLPLDAQKNSKSM